MAIRDRRIDAYIAKSADFARPILAHLREVVHAACPEVEETLKWSSPAFMYKGMLCGMAAFKQHATFGFWKGSLVLDPGDNKSAEAMGQFGRITSLKGLPPKKVIAGYVRAAMTLNDNGVKAMRPAPRAKKPLAVPADLKAALANSAKARKTFEKFPPSKKRDYVEWITEAKTEATRLRRLETAIQWMTEGKSRNWKYENC
ncbi:MAG: YdeI/OmpD-associated family protein [Candidatus Eisenbacteria bacterium]